LYNFSDVDTVIEKGKGCAQLVVYKLQQPIVEWADEVSDTNRGADGFGSSDSK
jgi:dUTPase